MYKNKEICLFLIKLRSHMYCKILIKLHNFCYINFILSKISVEGSLYLMMIFEIDHYNFAQCENL